MSVITPLLQFIGSLGFLLYGMKLMSNGIQNSAGEKLQRALSVVTKNRFVGLLTGLLITMIIQSSGATTVMVTTFVNAGLLTLSQSIGVIFGANIGTTITAWIVSIFGFNFDISAFAIPVIGIGYFLSIFKKARYKNIGEAVMGFGMLFLGLDGLKNVFTPEQLGFLLQIKGSGPLAILSGFFIGIVVTALLHSSSAFSAIVITMAYNGLLGWELAAAMTLGSNIGSTIDAILASLGATADTKRTALLHVMFNVFGTAIALIFFQPFLTLIEFITPKNANISIQISLLHTVFNTLTTIILFPLANQLCTLSRIIIKDDKTEKKGVYKLEFQEAVLGAKESLAAYIIRAEKAISDMTDVVSGMFDRIQIGVTKRNSTFLKDHVEKASDEENYVDQMHEQITHYLVKCESLPLAEKQFSHISSMLQIVDELENMSDNCYTTIMLLGRSIEKKMKYPSEDIERMLPYVELTRQFLQFVQRNINKHIDEDKLQLANELENGIDDFRKDLKKVARKRLESGADVKAELLYIDIVRQIEKIGDNCFSISESLTAI